MTSRQQPPAIRSTGFSPACRQRSTPHGSERSCRRSRLQAACDARPALVLQASYRSVPAQFAVQPQKNARAPEFVGAWHLTDGPGR